MGGGPSVTHPRFRAPLESPMRARSPPKTDLVHAKMHTRYTIKKIAWEGDKQITKQTDGQTSPLLDRIGPVG